MKNVLILSNDAFRVKAKTCRSLASACRRLNCRAWVRDTADARFAIQAVGADHRELRENLASKYIRLIEFLKIETVLSLDLDWLLLPDEFLNHPQIKRIVSVWFDDLRTWMTGAVHEYFPPSEGDLFDILKHPKVRHCFYGQGQALEARLLGITNQQISPLAADRDLLTENHPLEVKDRFAFIGNPGYRQKPHPGIVEAMHKGAELDELRALSREHILRQPPEEAEAWYNAEPSVRELIDLATQVRVVEPFTPACQILEQAGKEHPSAMEYLMENQQFLTACLLIKLVNHYDRPAFVYRLYQHNLVDVFSAPEEWEVYGVQSKPFVDAASLPALYQAYPAHLNAPNAIRDATANEKLFEISACGRVTINLDSPDIQSCYDKKEALRMRSLEELETTARELLKHPETTSHYGKKARYRTSLEHTWDQRLRNIL